MAMLTSTTNSAISFNSDFFDQEAIDKLLQLRLPDVPAVVLPVAPPILPMLELTAFKSRDAKALFDEAATQTAVDQALDILMEDPELRDAIKESGRDALMTKVRDDLTTQLKTASISDAVADNNKAARESIQLVTDPDGVVALEVAGTRLLAVNPALKGGDTFTLILEIAAVIFDIFALLCTVVDIAIAHGEGWIKRVAEFIKGFKQSTIDYFKNIFSEIGSWIYDLVPSGPPSSDSGWLNIVKEYAEQIGSFLAQTVKKGWKSKDFITTIRYCFKVLFAGPWYTKVYYLAALIASIILLIGTAGASIMVSIVLALIQLGLLIWDVITLITDSKSLNDH